MECHLKISKYSKRGHGLASIQKTPQTPPSQAEVVGSVVGDEVFAELLKKKKRAYATHLLKVLKPSPDRVTPRCQHAGSCGGCTWQQMDYQAQLKEKEKWVRALFPIEPRSIIPCEDPWRYRNKMEYSFSQSREGERFLGLIQARSKGKVINLKECHLTAPWFIQVLHGVKRWWEGTRLQAFHPYSGRGTLRTLTLREGKGSGECLVFLTISGGEYSINRDEIEGFKQAVRSALPDKNPALFLQIVRAQKGRPTTFDEMHLGGPESLQEELVVKGRKLTFSLSPTSFFQPNPRQAEKLFSAALDIASPQNGDRVYDLYCGTGTLGILFAPYVNKVAGIELSPYAACDAKVNAQANGCENLTIIHGDVATLLEERILSPDIAIVDPPRSGLDQNTIRHLLRLSPRKILYISCNIRTQSENLTALSKGGYTLKVVQPIDQFPHTVHLENIILLEKG